MAIFAAGSNQAIDFTSLDVADLVDGEITIATPTRIVVSQTADDYLEATGSFNVSNPEAITGTITGFVLVRGGDTIFTLTGASITVANFIALAETGNPDALLAQIFSGNDSIAGSPLDDHLKGYVGNDTLDGGGGADRMEGGAGNDRYVVDDVGDDIDEAAGGGTDLVLSEIDYELGANLENLTLTGDDAIDGTGNALVNLLVGNDKDNVLDGGASTDKMSGGKGDDTYVVDVAGDVITELKDGGDQDTVRVEAALSYVLGAELENLILDTAAKVNGTGNPLDNELTGGDGDNVLDGKAGADTMLGRGGSDTYVVDNADDEVDETGGGGTDLVQSSVSFTLADGVENLTLTGAAAINGTGNGADNAIVGNGGANLIDGKAGADKMTGGAGNDIYVVDNAGDQVVELAGGGTDEVRASVALAGAIANAENYSFTGAGPVTFSGDAAANRISGTAANDTFEGGGGNDTLDGGEGEDSLSGGLGNDLYVLTGFTEQVAELAGGGADLVQSLQSYTLTDNVENLTLTGDFDNRTATGNALANLITGSGGNDTLAGEGGNDTLVGGANNDRLDGGAGADKLVGGAGNDTYIVDAVGDAVTELKDGGASDTVRVQASLSYLLGAELENLILDTDANVNATGNALDNELTGGDGDNVLDGKAGADAMAGGKGNDTYIVDNEGDEVTEAVGQGDKDLVQSAVSFELSDNVENLTLTGAGSIDGTGNDLENIILGNSGANRIDGGAGADKMTGGAGDDIYVVDDAGDQVTELAGGGNDELQTFQSLTTTLANIEHYSFTGAGPVDFTGDAANNRIGGTSAADTIRGGAGNDTLDGQGGVDSLVGGLGNDLYVIDSASDALSESGGGGIDTVQSSTVNVHLNADFENLTLAGLNALNGAGSDLANVLTGNDADNVLLGNGGNDTILAGAGTDTLDGGTGTDKMTGGKGDDTYHVDVAGDIVTEALDEGEDTVESRISYLLGANLENLILTGTGSNNATGNSLDNDLRGNSGDNVLDGKAGADGMEGGEGNDTYIVDNAGDTVTESAGAGDKDLVQSAVSFELSANVENLTLTGAAAINGTGNGAGNIILGNSGANLIDGKAGADSMTGAGGNDTYLVDDIGDKVTELAGGGTDEVRTSLALTSVLANVENYVFTGAGPVDFTGDGVGNRIVGTAANDKLSGGAGNDTLDGAAGDDSLTGGIGNDVYVVDSILDKISEAGGGGTDTVQSKVTFELDGDFENLTLIGDSAISGTGNALANVILGNDANNGLEGGAGNDTISGGVGDDVLYGGAGADKMAGGKGDDTYQVDAVGDVVTEAADEGEDKVESSISYVLGANIENLTLTLAANVNATGNSLDNLLRGNSGDNVLDGKAGGDGMEGGEGNDTYIVDDVGDDVAENLNAGTDLVQSSVSFALTDNVENLTLTGTAAIDATGNDLANTILGNSGANKIDGGAGADKMTGGAGNDIYVVDDLGDQVVESAGGGTDEVRTSIALAGTIANVENYAFTGPGPVTFAGDAAANRILGTGANDTLDGGGGNDTLDGGEGEDSLSGGLGNDLYVLTGFTEQVAELAGGGTDLVQSLQSYTLTDNVENLTLTGDFDNRTATGNALANLITGSGGNDTLAGEGGNDTLVGGANNDRLDGGAGNDKLVGGAGNDTYVVDAGDSITELAGEGSDDTVIAGFSYVLGTELESLILTGTDHINGTGNAKDNTLTGNGNNNVLDGKAGADEMIGGDGDDTYIIDNVKDSVTESFGEGEDLVQTTVSFALSDNIENLTLTGAAAINGTGNDLDNVIFGNTSANVLTGGAGDDRLNGRAGADTMHGGLGDDTYVVDDSKDVTSESGGGGTDTVESSVTFSLVDGIENLVLTGSGAINGIGNGLGNEIGGNSGANALWGLAGADSIDGGGGNDTLTGGSGDDVIDVGNGNDVVRYTNDIDGHDVIDNFDGDAVGGQDVFSLDALFDEFEIATADRASSVDPQVVGATVEIRVDLDGLPGFELFVATLSTVNDIDIGTDVIVGSL